MLHFRVELFLNLVHSRILRTRHPHKRAALPDRWLRVFRTLSGNVHQPRFSLCTRIRENGGVLAPSLPNFLYIKIKHSSSAQQSVRASTRECVCAQENPPIGKSVERLSGANKRQRISEITHTRQRLQRMRQEKGRRQ